MWPQMFRNNRNQVDTTDGVKTKEWLFLTLHLNFSMVCEDCGGRGGGGVSLSTENRLQRQTVGVSVRGSPELLWHLTVHAETLNASEIDARVPSFIRSTSRSYYRLSRWLGRGRAGDASQRLVRLPERLVGDGQAGQPGAVIIHDVAGTVRRTYDLQNEMDADSQHGPTSMSEAPPLISERTLKGLL